MHLMCRQRLSAGLGCFAAKVCCQELGSAPDLLQHEGKGGDDVSAAYSYLQAPVSRRCSTLGQSILGQ